MDDDDSRLAAGMDGTTLRNGTQRQRESEGEREGGRGRERERERERAEGGRMAFKRKRKTLSVADDVTFPVNIKEAIFRPSSLPIATEGRGAILQEFCCSPILLLYTVIGYLRQ